MQSSQQPSPVSSLTASLNLSSEGIVVFEPVLDQEGGLQDMRIALLNDAAVSIFGIPAEVATGQLLSALWAMEEGDPGWDNVKKVLGSRQPMQYELHTDNLGDRRWFEITLRPFGANLAASYHEITEKKRHMLKLEEQQQFYEELIRQSPLRKAILSSIRNAAGEIENFRCDYANYGHGIDDSHRNLPRFDQDIIGKTADQISPDYRERPTWALYCALSDEGASAPVEMHFELDGKSYIVEVSGRRLDDGRLLISYADVSASRRIARELDTEKARLDAVLEHIPLGLTVFESVLDKAGELKDLRLVRRNEKALRFSQIPEEKYQPGALLSELMPKALTDNIELMLGVVRTGKQRVHELYQPKLDIWISSRIMKHGDGLLSTIQDITELKRHTEQINQQAQLLEGILQASPHAILVFEAVRAEDGKVDDFRIVRFNQRAALTTGLSGEQLSKTTLFTCMPSVRARLDRYLTVMETGEAETYEFYNEKLCLWRRITNTPLGDGFVMTMEDITEQKQISRKIEETAHLLNAVLNTSPIAVVVYQSERKADGSITDFRPIIANQQALDIAELSSETFMRLSFMERNKGREHDLFPSLVEVIERKDPRTYEHLVQSSGRWVRSITTPFGDGFIATSQDITEQKNQNKLIEEQALLFNGVLSSLQNGLTIFRIIRNAEGSLEDLEYIEIADSIQRDTGLSRDAIIGNRIRTLYPGIESTDYWRAYSKLVETGEPQQFETHFTLPGYDNYLLNWITPLGDDKLVSVYYIINDLKQAQRELEHTVHELSRSNEDLEQFASIASHDLQEPLRKVQSFGAMLESKYADALGESGRDLLGRMQNAAGRMRNLVTGLLAFARLSGDEHLPLSAVDLHTLLLEITTDLDQAAESEKGTITIPARLPFVMGIEGQLRHLFHNLLTNALKFHKDGIAPEVSITFHPANAEDITRLSPLVSGEAFLRIEVTDKGIGFEPEYSEKIFGLFERLHGMNVYKGTGIGLSICRRVAERHGGTIWAESSPGEGAKFIVLLRQAL